MTMTHRVVLKVGVVLRLPPVLRPLPHVADDVLQAKLVLLRECRHLENANVFVRLFSQRIRDSHLKSKVLDVVLVLPITYKYVDDILRSPRKHRLLHEVPRKEAEDF